MRKKKQQEIQQIQREMKEMQPIILVICRNDVEKARYRCVRSNKWIYAKLYSGTADFPEYLQIRKINVTVTPLAFYYDDRRYTSHMFLMGLNKDKIEFDDTIYPLEPCLIDSLDIAISIKFPEDNTHIRLEASEYAQLDSHNWIRRFVHAEIKRLNDQGYDVPMF